VGLSSQAEVVRDGLRWELDLCEGIDLAIYLFGKFERETASAIYRLLNQGDVVLDIGANIGAHTLPMARCVGASGKVFAFEPTEFAFRKLQRNVALNAGIESCIVLEQIMLGETSHANIPDRIYSSWPLTDASHLHEKHRGQLMPTTGAWVSSIDDYVRNARIHRVDLIKIDVDGCECAVLKGADSTLKRSRPRILIECAPYVLEEAGSSVEELCEILLRQQYRLCEIMTGKSLPITAKGLKGIVPDGCGMNVIAVPC
jgi:FkbM family methyltransferase